MSDPRTRERDHLAERLVVELGAAFHQRAIYPSAHPQVRRSVERTVAALEAWCEGLARDEASLIRLEDQLLVDRDPVPEEATWRRGLVQALERLGLSGITLGRGLTTDELALFLDACCAHGEPRASQHVQFGRAAYFEAAGGGAGASGEVDGGARVGAESLEAARVELDRLARGAAMRVERLRGLVARLARAASSTRVDLATEEGIADRAFRHGLAVAIGSLRLASRLGLEGEPLEEAGLAGLLHDIGYLASGQEQGPELEFRRRLLHPVRGAARLAGIEGVADAVVVATYEHHLRFDGAESYPRLARPRRPTALARLVAVADTWVAIRTATSLSPSEVAEVVRARAGTFLDPELVEAFLPGLEPPA